MSVTDGNLGALDAAEMKVAIDGTATTSLNVAISQGGNTANVAVPGPNLGAGLVVSTGALISSTTQNALTAAGPGVVVDFGSGKANITYVWTTTAGITAGAVALEVSQDNINWFRTGTPVTLTASTTGAISVVGAYRYARGAITTTVTGGTVSGTLMAS